MRELLNKARRLGQRFERGRQLDPRLRFNTHLDDFSRSKGFSREAPVMLAVERQLTATLERGIEREHGDDIALGIAIVQGKMAIAEIASMAWFPNGGLDHFFTQEHNKAILETAEWLPTRFGSSNRSQDDYERLLRDVDDQIAGYKLPQ